jgi:hypothetical protein
MDVCLALHRLLSVMTDPNAKVQQASRFASVSHACVIRYGMMADLCLRARALVLAVGRLSLEQIGSVIRSPEIKKFSKQLQLALTDPAGERSYSLSVSASAS